MVEGIIIGLLVVVLFIALKKSVEHFGKKIGSYSDNGKGKNKSNS